MTDFKQAAALATRASAVEPGEGEHLEEGALLFYAVLTGRDHAQGATKAQAWLDRERIRRAKR